jgi:hypothetical protein
VQAQRTDLSGIKIYINPGHGGYDSDDRNLETIPFPLGNQQGFYESSANLTKGLELERLLKQSGATVVMSRTQNRTEDDRALSQIAEEANAGNCDAFISIHSNALGTNTGTNYLLFLYKETPGTGQPAKPKDVEMCKAAWPFVFENALTIWTGSYTMTNPCIRGDYSFLTYNLGVLKPLTIPGFLVEGSFHDYQPETHRLLNDDYRKLTAVQLQRYYLSYYGANAPTVGVIAGALKDANSIIDNSKYKYIAKSSDRFLPINGATVTLKNAENQELATYTTDAYYNGIFVFRDLAPGTYHLSYNATGYNAKDTTVVVEAAKTTDFVTHLVDPNYTPPEPPVVEPNIPNIYASELTAEATGAGKYKIGFTLNADAISLTIDVYQEKGTVLKSFPVGALEKGRRSVEIDISDLTVNGLSWSITAQGEAVPGITPRRFSSDTDKTISFAGVRGMAVDNNMESPYFGRVYVTNHKAGTVSGRTLQSGLFILDAALTDVTGQGDNAYRGNVNWHTSASPQCPAVSDDGYIYLADWADAHSGVWRVEAGNPTKDFVPVFGGNRASSGLTTADDGTVIHGSVVSLWIKGSGAQTQLFTSDEDYTVTSTNKTKAILRYDIGTLDQPWTKAPSAVVFDNAEGRVINGTDHIAPDGRFDGWWITQYRETGNDGAAVPSLIHVNKAGAIDYNSAGYVGDSRRGALAVTVDGSRLAVGTNDELKIYDVSFTEAGVPSITLAYSITPAAGTDSYGAAFDLAGNIYLGADNPGSLGAWAIPKAENKFTTAAPAALKLDVATGIQDAPKTDEITINPRPMQRTLHIASTGEVLRGIAIYSLTGQLLLSLPEPGTQEVTLDVSALSPGLYLLKVNNRTFKVMKQ